MYNEDSFKNYIFWIKVKRVFLMILFSIIGTLIGIAISEYFVNILLFEAMFRVIIITISTLLFFAISLLLTANTGKEIQEGYWKIAVLRKLTVISKKLDALENLDLKEGKDFKTSQINKQKNISSIPLDTSEDKDELN